MSVQSVSPGGLAEAAALEVGDIVTSIARQQADPFSVGYLLVTRLHS